MEPVSLGPDDFQMAVLTDCAAWMWFAPKELSVRPLVIGHLVTMLRWEVAIVAVLYCNVLTCAAPGRAKGLPFL
ncbi:hypothetical protein MATL_G00247020 [Megalops atlanticus]|uniref:Uncharacterized protein n=1 Tax=Megalops atlanticus TaxID=7932 RepID=A0A9D3PB13_MEGAT|nr:hypothetical protein MATL_G00247020 [Megalops atlanticus]